MQRGKIVPKENLLFQTFHYFPSSTFHINSEGEKKGSESENIKKNERAERRENERQRKGEEIQRQREKRER